MPKAQAHKVLLSEGTDRISIIRQDHTGTEPGMTILYVSDPLVSARFYARLLRRPAIETSSEFVVFALDDGGLLGLWARRDCELASVSIGRSAEATIVLNDAKQLNNVHAEWKARGLTIVEDPDGHLLRVITLEAA